MSDFMIWLYLHYIKPYLDTVPADDYNFHMDMIHNELGYHALESYEKNLEFTAFHAFLLGLRTGAGLGALIPQGTAPSAPGPSACTPP